METFTPCCSATLRLERGEYDPSLWNPVRCATCSALLLVLFEFDHDTAWQSWWRTPGRP